MNIHLNSCNKNVEIAVHSNWFSFLFIYFVNHLFGYNLQRFYVLYPAISRYFKTIDNFIIWIRRYFYMNIKHFWHYIYTAGYGWGIFCVLNISQVPLCGWYTFMCSVKCYVLMYGDTRNIFRYFLVRILEELHELHFGHKFLVATWRGAISGNTTIWCKVFNIFFKLWQSSANNFMLISQCASWHTQYLLPTNQCRINNSYKAFNSQALTIK